ncbi:hypothetical protein A8L45_20245 [Veronia pacifica]|uniref:Uncharacterized protein n=1 Tax=Veronia pacifica TaxID=1080227 RepID=A0A1C3EB96_9GAMM|nr:hypothetical protein A8L45_20245 [Veronia pacifica]
MSYLGKPLSFFHCGLSARPDLLQITVAFVEEIFLLLMAAGVNKNGSVYGFLSSLFSFLDFCD